MNFADEEKEELSWCFAAAIDVLFNEIIPSARKKAAEDAKEGKK